MGLRKENFERSILAEKIFEFRKQRGLTQNALAMAMGIAKTVVSKMENQTTMEGSKISKNCYESLKAIGFSYECDDLIITDNNRIRRIPIRHANLSILIKQKDPNPLFEQSMKLAKEATDLVKTEKQNIEEQINRLAERESELQTMLTKFKEFMLSL